MQYQDFHSSRKRSVQNDCRGTTIFDSFYCIYLNIRCDFINLSSGRGGEGDFRILYEVKHVLCRYFLENFMIVNRESCFIFVWGGGGGN